MVLSGNSWKVMLVLFAGLFYVYYPSLKAGFFSTDDFASFMLPYITNPGFYSLKAIFTPGSHVDFYPIRDLSYLLDFLLWKDSSTLMRLHQLIIMCVISFFIYQILVRINVRPTLALALTCVWALHPYHVESVVWITARKDLLAVMFGLISTYFFLGAAKIIFLLMGVFFFVLSLGAKASLTLLPLAVLFPLWKTRHKPYLFSVFVAALVGIISALYQSWFYTNINSMSVHWPWDMRLESSAAALGRMFFGWFYPKVNAIDIDNFGEWLVLNRDYRWLGFFLWVVLLLLILKSFRRKNFAQLALGLAIAGVYVPISGIVFEHVNFYSTRYFEPAAIVILISIGVFLQKRISKFGPVVKVVVVLMLGFEAWATRSYAEAWADGNRVRRAALELSPNSVSLKAALLGDLISASSAQDLRIQKEELRTQLAKQCEAVGAEREIWFSNCHSYFRYGYFVMKEQGNFVKARYYLDLFVASRKIFTPLPPIVERLEADYALATGNITSEMSQAWISKEYLLTEDYRVYHLIFSCLNNVSSAKEKFERWKKEGLISPDGVFQFLNRLDREVQLASAPCFQ